MYVIPDFQLNKFKDVKIPPASELMRTMQEKTPVGHGDPASGLPENLQGVDNLDKLMMAKRMLEQEIAAAQAAQKQNEVQSSEQTEPAAE